MHSRRKGLTHTHLERKFYIGNGALGLGPGWAWPLGAGSAPDTQAMDLRGCVALCRELHFFASLGHLTDPELMEHLGGRFRERHRRELDPTCAHDVLLLLDLDEDRVWWQDLEDDVFPGQNAYVGIFAEWACISRGAFRPEDVREEWGRDGDPPVRITFRLGDQEHRLRTTVDEWIDLGLLRGINRLIQASGYFFESGFRTWVTRRGVSWR